MTANESTTGRPAADRPSPVSHPADQDATEHGSGGDDARGEHDMTVHDEGTLDTLRRMWEVRDPVPADLAERVSFALALEHLDAEVMMLAAEVLVPVGARGEEHARSVTFSSDHLSVMVTFTDADPDAVRVDGWIGEGAGMTVGVRPGRTNGVPPAVDRTTTADDDGRFSFVDLPHGLVQLVFQSGESAALRLPRPVVTPAVQI